MKKMTKQKITKTQRIKIHHYNSNDDDDDGTIIIINGISINIQKGERKIYLWTTTTMTKRNKTTILRIFYVEHKYNAHKFGYESELNWNFSFVIRGKRKRMISQNKKL